MMRAPYAVMMLAIGLAACSPKVPESGAGPGFQDYNSYMRDKTSGIAAPTGSSATTSPMTSTGFSPDTAAAAIDAASGNGAAAGTTTAPMVSTGPTAGKTAIAAGTLATGAGPTVAPPIDSAACAGRGNAFAGIKETTSEMNYASGGVSDEQDFKAVTGRETIASDKERIECNKEQYVVVQPSAIPARPGDEGPNIAAYALATTNQPGVKMYSRPPFYLTSPEKACAKFASPDLAQQAFLAAGGPQRDPKALDPDGDGFACTWDPRPFRIAKQ